MPRLEPGILVGDYRLERILGEGGMGTVWAASHHDSGTRVALKVLHDRDSTDPVRRRRLLREARAAGSVIHSNVVKVHEVFEDDDGAPVIAMDLLEGETLSKMLVREVSLSLAAAARLMAPVVSAIGTAHAAGVVHRDLKPENIFLVREGHRQVPVVLDFGIAKVPVVSLDGTPTAPLTTTGAVLGTPHYMPPEQIFGERAVDHRADIWALGAILYECLAGRRAVPGSNVGQVLKLMLTGTVDPLRQHAPRVPVEVASLVDLMLAREIDRRPDLREVHAVLSGLAGAPSVSFAAARPVPPEESLPATVLQARLPSPDREQVTVAVRASVPPLPCAPGRSPFHIKGVAYRGLLRFIERRVAGGLEALGTGVEDARIIQFLRQPFLASSWYDLLPIVPISAALAHTVGRPLETFAREQGAGQAHYDAEHQYHRLFHAMSLDDPAGILSRLERQWYDFGNTVGELIGPGHSVYRRIGLPEFVLCWFAPMHAAYAEQLLRMKGATVVRSTLAPPVPAGVREGFPLVDFDTHLFWQ